MIRGFLQYRTAVRLLVIRCVVRLAVWLDPKRDANMPFQNDPVVARLKQMIGLDASTAAARLALARQRRRDLLSVVTSPTLQADARYGDAEARRDLEQAGQELFELGHDVEALERYLTAAGEEGRCQ